MKRLIYILLFVPLALFGQQLHIGDENYGGIIFYLEDDSLRGLVAAKIDLVDGGTDFSHDVLGFQWGCYYDNYPSNSSYYGYLDFFNSDELGSGYQNTLGLAENCETAQGGVSASQACLNYQNDGYNDWFLPSLQELIIMRDNISQQSVLGNIGEFIDHYYWSSTAVSWGSDGAEYIIFGNAWNGYNFLHKRYNDHRVRPVRYFEIGCMDSTAYNYNLNATEPDSSCLFLEGCTDENSFNYHEFAVIDDGSCFPVILGCLDINAHNYNDYDGDLHSNVLTGLNYVDINTDDGSCITYEEFLIDSLHNVNSNLITDLYQNELDYINSISSLQQALDTWNTSIDLGAGWNMFGYGCPTSIDVADGLSNHTENIIITKDNNGNVYMPEFDFNGIGDFTPGFGYQIKLTEAIEGFSLCDWYVNDIPEDNIVSLHDSIDILNSEILDLDCINQGACSFNIALNECEFNQDGYDCEGNYILQIGDEAHGGIVFYHNVDEEYGLVCADPSNAFMAPWGCSDTEVLGAQLNWYGAGSQNTLDIVNQGCSTLGGTPAAQLAWHFELNGYNDWYLPSTQELYSMPLCYGCMYWSSQESGLYSDQAIRFRESNSSTHELKIYEYPVLPIRAFGNWNTGCMNPLACNYNYQANLADGSCTFPQEGYDCYGNITEYIVGMEAEGGIVFYVDETGEHGLVAAMEDFEDEVNWETAINLSNELNYNQFNDWYLPEIHELEILYNNLGINHQSFKDSYYWSSTEYSDIGAMFIDFTNGNSGETNKNGVEWVRPIRSF